MSAVEAPAGTAPVVSVDAHSAGIISTSGLLVLRRVIVTLGSAVATAVIARHLTTNDFGVYSAALATFYIAQAFCDLGFGSVLARELAVRTDEQPKLLWATLRPSLAWSLTVGVAFAVFALTTSHSIRMLCLLVLSAAVAVTGASVARQWFIVHYDVRRMAEMDTVCNLAQIGGLITAVLLGAGPVVLAGIVAVSAMVNTVTVSVRALRKAGRVRTSFGESRALIVMSLPIGIPSVLASAYFSVDLVLAGYLISATEVAKYAAAVKLLSLVTILPSLLVSVALPGFSAIGQTSDRQALGELVGRIWQWMVVVGLPVCAALAFFAPLAIELFFGSQYDGSIGPLRVLMGAGVLALLGNIFGMLLIATRRVAATLYQNIFALTANIGFNIVLLPKYGIMAAAWLTLATEAVIVICSFVLLRRTLSWGPFVRVSRAPFAAAAVLAACSFLPVGNDVLRAALAGAACVALLTLLRGWPFDPGKGVQSLRRRISRGRTS